MMSVTGHQLEILLKLYIKVGITVTSVLRSIKRSEKHKNIPILLTEKFIQFKINTCKMNQ